MLSKTTTSPAALLHTFWYDSLFYAIIALMLLAYQLAIENAGLTFTVFISIMLVAGISLLWLWNTSALYGYFGKRKSRLKVWSRHAAALFFAAGCGTLLLIFGANIIITSLLEVMVKQDIPVILSSLVVSTILLGAFIPLFVIITTYLHAKTMEMFFNEKHMLSRKLHWCVIVFSCTTIIALALKFLPEWIELAVSGLLLMAYFTWQKAYLLAK